LDASCAFEFGLQHLSHYSTGGFFHSTPITISSGLPSIAGGLGFSFKEDERAALEAGMQAHIAKPIDVGVMMKTPDKVLRTAGHA
jgi:hypothetical protein